MESQNFDYLMIAFWTFLEFIPWSFVSGVLVFAIEMLNANLKISEVAIFLFKNLRKSAACLLSLSNGELVFVSNSELRTFLSSQLLFVFFLP